MKPTYIFKILPIRLIKFKKKIKNLLNNNYYFKMLLMKVNIVMKNKLIIKLRLRNKKVLLVYKMSR